MSHEITPEEQRVIDELSNRIASDLAHGKKKESIVKKLVTEHWPKQGAVTFVDSVEKALDKYRLSPEGKKAITRQSKLHKIYGISWIAGGIVICLAAFFTNSSLVTYIIGAAAFVYGILDFIRGFRNRIPRGKMRK
jgi:hypothetical protein